ncbi:MAG: DnaB-like helicase C-terminal domain-containing protein, partial [bacterium]
LENIENLLVMPDLPEDIDPIEKEMARTIYKTDEAGWKKGEGILTGFPILDEKLDSIQQGLAFLAADSNTGKSSYLLSIGYNSSKHDDAFVLYFSLDDDVTNLLPRVISMEKSIPINAIRLPYKYKEYPSILKKRKQGIEDLYKVINRFKIVGADKAQGVENMEKIITKHKEYADKKNKKLFVLIDNFHDLYSEEKDFYDQNDKFAYIAGVLKDWTKEFSIPVWCTAEVRKLNSFRRPVKDDLLHAGKIKYKASLILMLHNDVGLQGSNASVYYRNKDKPGKAPVLEVKFDKNKLGSFKGTLFYEFIPEYAHFLECNEEDIERYNSLVYQSEN